MTSPRRAVTEKQINFTRFKLLKLLSYKAKDCKETKAISDDNT